MVKKHAFNVLKIVVSLGLLVFLFFQIDLAAVWSAVQTAQVGYLAAAGLLMVLGTALRALRWKALLDALEIRVGLGRLVQLYFVGAFFNIFLPSGLGGDAVKMMELSRTTGRGPEAVGTTLVDRALGLWVLFLLALVALPFSAGLLPAGMATTIALISAAGVVGGALVMGTPLIPWLGSKVRLPGQAKLERFYRAVAQLGWPALGRAALISLVFNLMLIGFMALIALGFGVRLPLEVFVLFTPMISLTLTVPISIGGLGVRDNLYPLLFGPLGVPIEVSIAMSLMNYFLTNILVGLIGGLLYLREGVVEGRRKLAETE